ncbi:methyl-accepting chemotaxis protein [Clostridium sp. MSJ-4]|uniref:Methyl-accepting chemotaxis protein n=1 Tax=Clostridium simiarum TaxID=2841506 RepID=A0ABS6F0B2_9CLOT|nr:methyl-accepting chemotaxis protein [Clostridium simiarum]MBU5591678.1 methyl-accepting chemotaxis protein [Clostridium simiarum]
MLNSIRKKIMAAFIIVTTVSMIAMILIVGYGSAKVIFSREMLDNDTFVNQMARSIEAIGVDDRDKVQEYINKSVDSEESIINIQLTEASGKIIFDRDKSKVGTNADSEVMQALEDSSKQEYFSDDNFFTITVPVKKDGMLIGVISVTSKMDSTIKNVISTIKSIGIFALLTLFFAIVVAYLVSKMISRPIKNTVIALDRISTGDLTANMRIESKDEFGILAKTMNNTMNILREMIGSIKQSTISLDKVSHVLSSSSQEVSSSNMEVANSASKVADSVSQQSIMLTDSVELLSEFGNTIDIIHTNVGNVSSESQKIKESAYIGSLKIEELVQSVSDIRHAFKYVIEKLATLNSSVEKITEITAVINNVAGQTNLLALNASIEAARSGEAGKGFAVVAEEIRILAEQVSSSSNSIIDLVSNVTMETKDVTQTANSVSDKMKSQVDTVENTIESFKDILSQVSLILPQIENINTELKSAVKVKEQVMQKVGSVANMSAEVTASSQQIAASTQEQIAFSEELTSMAQSLESMSCKLRQSVERIKV